MNLWVFLAALRVPHPGPQPHGNALPIPGAPLPPNSTLWERILDSLNNLAINNIWPTVLALLACAAVAYWCWRRKRKQRRWYLWPLPLAIVAFLIAVGGGVNWHFGYYATAGDLFDSYNFPTGGEQLLTSHSGRYPAGVVVSARIPSPVSQVGAQNAAIFLPPQYFTAPANYKFPVVYLYPGVPGTELDWFTGGQAWQTGLAAAKAGKPVVFVSVNVAPSYGTDTECVNGLPGNWETYLAQDVPTWIAKSSRTLTGAGANATAGLSMGGYCAQMLAIRHPDLFGQSGNFSGTTLPTYDGGMEALFGPGPGLQQTVDSYNTNFLIQHEPESRSVDTWLEVGSSDDPLLIADQKQFDANAAALGMNTTFSEVPGAHEFYVWAQCLKDWLPQALSTLDPPAPQPAGPNSP